LSAWQARRRSGASVVSVVNILVVAVLFVRGENNIREAPAAFACCGFSALIRFFIVI
jgi:hypothetical protein